jgi:hypothetical protein
MTAVLHLLKIAVHTACSFCRFYNRKETVQLSVGKLCGILGTEFVFEYSFIFYEISGYHIQNYAIKIFTVPVGVLNA